MQILQTFMLCVNVRIKIPKQSVSVYQLTGYELVECNPILLYKISWITKTSFEFAYSFVIMKQEPS